MLHNEPEYYGLTEAEFSSLPWQWIVLAVVYILAGAFVVWAVKQERGDV